MPFSLDPLVREAKRRARRRWLLLVGAAVLITGGAVGTAIALRAPNGPGGPSGVSLSSSAGTGSSSGRVSDVQFTYPRRYYTRPFASCRPTVTGQHNGRCDRGVVIASYPLKPQPEIGGSGAHFSSKGVALELYQAPADQGLANMRLGDRRLSLWQFSAAEDVLDPPGEKPPPPQQWGAWFRVNGASYWAIAWVGNKATQADRTTLAVLVNSVHAFHQTPHAPSPKPPPQVTRVLCTGTASSPRMPHGALASGPNLICAQVSGQTCHVWTRPIDAPAADVRQRHFELRSSFCAYTRGFLRDNPRGYVAQPANPGLAALLAPARS